MSSGGRTVGSVRMRRDERGATAVEFALILVPLLVVIFGLVQYGLYFYSAQSASNTANTAVRQLAVGNCQNSSTLQTFVDKQLGAAETGNATVTRTYVNADGTSPTPPEPANVTIGGTVTLTISVPTLNMHFPFVPFLSNSTVQRTVQARVEDTTEQAGSCT